MREWIEEISDYIQEREVTEPPLIDLSEEIYQAALETEMLLEATNDIQSAFTTLVGKIEHANS